MLTIYPVFCLGCIYLSRRCLSLYVYVGVCVLYLCFCMRVHICVYLCVSVIYVCVYICLSVSVCVREREIDDFVKYNLWMEEKVTEIIK